MTEVPDDPFDNDAKWAQRTALSNEALLSGIYWDEVRTLLAIAKFGSMNRAAEYLGVRQDKVSRQMRHLQSVTRCQLLVQRRTGTRLTERGEELAQLALRFDQALFSLTSDLKGETELVEGSVRITITDGLGMAFLVPALRAFSREFPRIQVHLKTPTNFRDLRENQTDMMLGFRKEDGDDIVCRPLGQLHFLPMTTSHYLESRGVPTTGNLERHSFIDSDQYSAKSGVFDRWHALTSQGQVGHWADASFTYAMLVKSGFGIGLLGNYAIFDPQFVPIDLGCHITLELFGSVLEERLRSKPVGAVYDLLCKVFGPENPWFSDRLILDTSIQAPGHLPPHAFHLPHLD